MKKIVGFSIILTSLFATDYQVGAGIGAGNGYKFMNVRMEEYLSPQNTIRFEMEKTTKNKNNITTKGTIGISQKLNTEEISPYVFTNVGYQAKSGDKKNGAIANIGVGVSYEINKNIQTFVEMKAIRDFANKENNYEVLAGMSYKFISSEEDKELQYSSAVPADDIIKENKKEIKKIVKLDKPKIKKEEKIEKNAEFSENDIISLEKESNLDNKVVISQNENNLNNFKFVMHFSRNSRYIQEEDMKHLIDFAEYLQSHPNVKAEIQGYTDNKGSFVENQSLSERKARLVYNILLDLGVDKKQLSYKGYGAVESVKSKNERANRVIAKIYS